ncbi:Uncharacterised protein [Zhongshania aliphaticivorans]|uniref:Uncharacterized protein n=1 Tax=Zhongshania aliphaticivorans TaxID=1470434 RepID=A0A5S9N4V1_9GAMM|nr:hypothetical protein [Zhongshania aliphaticivorans]CAA0082596.1 Uncharacterised protein [Zhongshania aliphaticivorans]CAA0084111.1 Uncharacterised protein [Zhongshania aliphaticivorans]
MYSLEQSIEFESQANPHSWFLVASELHEQAELLKEECTSKIIRHDRISGSSFSWGTSNRTVILLAGFALENLLKGFLIYEHPSYVKNGFLSKKLQTHKLTKLAKESTYLPYKSQSYNTLKYFEDGLESWARYPCGLNWAQTKDPNLLTKKVWNNYLWLVGVYEARFKKIMLNGWEGPHHFEGSFEITGDWLQKRRS